MSEFSIINGNNTTKLSNEDLIKKFSKIASLENKFSGWVTKDLDVRDVSKIKQLVWMLLTYLPSIRKYLYNIDLKQSFDILAQLKPQIADNMELKELFNNVVVKLADITNKYNIDKFHLHTKSNIVSVDEFYFPIVNGDSKDDNKVSKQETKKEDLTQKKTETKKQETIKIEEPKSHEKAYPTLKGLIDQLNQYWDQNTQTFKNIPFNEKIFYQLLKDHFEVFKSKHDFNTDHGFISKKNMQEGDKIYVHADFHGDLEGLKKVLDGLVEDGLLDKNYKCKPGVHLVFLGDYGDRGTNTLEVLQLLMTLQLENKDQVTLIKGNHENPAMNINHKYCQNDKKLQRFLYKDTDKMTDKDLNLKIKNKDQSLNFNKESIQALNTLYSTMPLSFYAGSYNKDKKRWEYVQYTHGLFEFEIPEFLDSGKSIDSMVIPKAFKLSEKISNLAEDNTNYDKLIKEEKYISKINEYKKKQKLRDSAKRIQQLALQDKLFRILTLKHKKDSQLEHANRYVWGDIGHKSSMGDPRQRQWSLAPLDIKHYLRVSSTKTSKVFQIIRGHQHFYRNHIYKENGSNQEKLVSSTLPISMFSKHAKNKYTKQWDTAYIFTIGTDSKNWKKQALYFNPDNGKMVKSQLHLINSVEI